MNSPTRILCQKYTDLTDEEIAYLEKYNELLPALANAEEADVFVDCRTATGRSAIVVCEAKPQTVPSNYSTPILGMLIQWKDEPAVDRSFRLGLATVGMRAISMPEDRRIVQTVEPIRLGEKLIGVLIYEKSALAAEKLVHLPEDSQQHPEELDWAGVSDYLSEAVIFLDGSDLVCGYNRAARELYQRLGYIGDIMGMAASNIQPAALTNCADRVQEGFMVDRALQCRRVPVSGERARWALVIRDVTEQRRAEQECSFQEMALRELRHRMKNNIQMIASMMRSRSFEVNDPTQAQTTLLNMSNRLLSITATLDGIVRLSPEKVSLLQVLEQIRKYTLQTLLIPTKNVAIRVQGEDVEVSADCATSVALVVNELVQNALKYAFPAGQAGVVRIELGEDRPLCRISVRDDGVGFRPVEVQGGGTGLELASAIVRDKLNGEWNVETGAGGTAVSFDFLER